MRSAAALLCLVTFVQPALAHDAKVLTTVILVRHAEKSLDAALTDPPLNEAGKLRAAELARVLGGAGIGAIYTTPYERTRQTAAPLAAALALQPMEIQAAATYAKDVVARIRAEHAGHTVLVVGHSNTTPDVIQELGIADAPAIAESEFDHLFVVTIGDGVAPRLVALRYGAAGK